MSLARFRRWLAHRLVRGLDDRHQGLLVNVADEPLSPIASSRDPRSPRAGVYHFDALMEKILPRFTVEQLINKPYEELLKTMRELLTANAQGESSLDKGRLWEQIIEQHCRLLVRHLDRLELLVRPYQHKLDTYAEMSFDRFQVYFDSTCLNLDTIVANVYYHFRQLEEDQRIDACSQWLQLRLRDYQDKKEVDKETVLDDILQENGWTLRRSQREKALSWQRPHEGKIWVEIEEASVTEMVTEIGRQRIYSLICDGNYYYEMWDRLDDNLRGALASHERFRAIMEKMLLIKEAVLGVGQVGEPTLGEQWMTFVYHWTELVILPILLIMVKPGDLFEGDANLYADSALICVTFIFLVFGSFRLRYRAKNNRAALLMCRRKHFLTKCMFIALLARVGLLIELLVPEPTVIRRPEATASINQRSPLPPLDSTWAKLNKIERGCSQLTAQVQALQRLHSGAHLVMTSPASSASSTSVSSSASSPQLASQVPSPTAAAHVPNVSERTKTELV